MPLSFRDATSPTGVAYLFIDTWGVIELEDAQAFVAQLDRPEHDYGRVLSVVQPKTDFRPKARKVYMQVENFSAVAVVVNGAIVRAAINLMIRLMHHRSGVVSLFETVEAAEAWLEQQPLRQRPDRAAHSGS
ncbi:hypothetical protein PPSIR1_02658 [Plesiocystis pacifica SIR-1]|uniref:STAS/SEC14 domain-containing protein n=1 Tax=Plesiocystis pacifica SIR-1 TaxID=391625 RepID=A6GKE8_9BACT|nr:STAS/SEC14 domain-containing protein [Plesiocystis pacifica]EDM73650.1 hypothetical protein PPSIR1_02658 [Plesiocystis pacifica SIR-1]